MGHLVPQAASRALDLVDHMIDDIIDNTIDNAAATPAEAIHPRADPRADLRADSDRARSGSDGAMLERLIVGLRHLTVAVRYADSDAVDHPALRWLDTAVELASPDRRPMAEAFAAAAPFLQWNTAYSDVEATADFERFRSNYTFATVAVPEQWSPGTGPLAVPAGDGPSLFLVVQGPGQIYPRHRHPAVEIYGIVAGTGDWQRGDEEFRPRRAGEVFVHDADTVHATTTTTEPTISWAAWLGDLTTGPRLDDPAMA